MALNSNRHLLVFITTSLTLISICLAGEVRPMETDRPSKTEEVQTVEPHRIQLETELIGTQLNRTTDAREELINIAELNLRLGLTTKSEIGLLIPTYLEEKTVTQGIVSRRRGMGDLRIRYRYNLIGNQGEKYGASLIPVVKLPTASGGLTNDRTEVGMIVPLKYRIDSRQNLKSALQVIRERKDASDGWHTFWQTTLCYTRSLSDVLQGFTELAASSYDDEVLVSLTFDFGLMLKLGVDLQLDYATYIGLTEIAEDYRHYVGISFKH